MITFREYEPGKWIYQFPSIIPECDWAEFLRHIEESHLGKEFSWIAVIPGDAVMLPMQRHDIAYFFRQFRYELSLCLGHAIVMPAHGKVSRLVADRIMWIVRPPFPHKVFKCEFEAKQWIELLWS